MTEHRTVAFVVSNKATSSVTGWPIGFWLAELSHPYREFADAGWAIELYSPEGGALYVDDYSDPYADNGYSADDDLSKAFLDDPSTRSLLDDTRPLAELTVDDADVVFLVGGQGPMETFRGNPEVERVVSEFFSVGKTTVVVCHATSVLLDARDAEGNLIVSGRRWTGFTNAEEQYAEDAVGQKFQPFWIEQEATKIPDTEFVAGPPMSSHVIRSDHLVTGQQQHSGGEAARVAIKVTR